MSEQLLEQIVDKLNNIEKTMATKDELNSFKAEFNNFKDDTKNQFTRVHHSIESLVIQQQGDVNRIMNKLEENVVDVKSRVRNMENLQQRQQKVLELLMSRSNQHESEIKRLKNLR